MKTTRKPCVPCDACHGTGLAKQVNNEGNEYYIGCPNCGGIGSIVVKQQEKNK